MFRMRIAGFLLMTKVYTTEKTNEVDYIGKNKTLFNFHLPKPKNGNNCCISFGDND
jgi:hypothetical protein